MTAFGSCYHNSSHLQWEIIPAGPGYTIRRVQRRNTSRYDSGLLNDVM